MRLACLTVLLFTLVGSSLPAQVHPRLVIGPEDLVVLRQKITQPPYDEMWATLLADAETGQYRAYAGPTPSNPTAPTDAYGESVNAFRCAFIYAVTQDDTWAQKARFYVQKRFDDTTVQPWATNQKGLSLYWHARHVALAYDYAYGAPSWDAAWCTLVSEKLLAQADLIATSGGTEQNTNAASNWQGLRGSSAVLAYLAADLPYNATNYKNSYNRTRSYLQQNLGSGTSKGWNIEGIGYLGYPYGAVAPAMVAAKRAAPANDLFASTPATAYMMWTQYAATVRFRRGDEVWLLHPDFGDDNATADDANGMYGFAFLHSPASLHAGLKWWYDRLLVPEKNYDYTRGGTIYSLLYYPASVVAQDPLTSADWRNAFLDGGGNGFFTFRNAYRDEQDLVAQIYLKLRGEKGHSGPDALTFRILGQNTAWAVGGGRYGTKTNNQDVYWRSQNTLYSVDPDATLSINSNSGSVVGTPVVNELGGGHVVSRISRNNVGTNDQTRWFLSDHDPALGVDAVYIIADTSADGYFWQFNTLEENSFDTSGAPNTFTVMGQDGATLRGTVLYPSAPVSFTTGTRVRGSHFAYGRVGLNNKFLHFQGPGDYVVVLTAARAGQTHPVVSKRGGRVVGSTVQVGGKSYGITSNGILYNQDAPLVGVAPGGTPRLEARGHPTFSEVELTWDAAPDATGYVVWRSANQGATWSPVRKVFGVTTALDPSLPTDTEYWYRVQPISAGGDGPLSPISKARTSSAGTTGLIATESFEGLPVGSLSNQGSGNGWAGAWTNATATIVDVTGRPLSAVGVSGGDRAVSIAWGDECGRRTFANAATWGTQGVYVSYLLRYEKGTVANDDRVWLFGSGSNYDWVTFGANTSNGGTTGFRAGRTYNNQTYGGPAFLPGQTYFIVAHIEANRVRLWVNKTDPASTPDIVHGSGPSSNSGTSKLSLPGIGLSSRSVVAGTKEFYVDRIVVARSFAEVVAGPSEPDTPTAWLAAQTDLPAEERTATADPDRDGLPNLLEYAFGTSPAQRDSARRPRFERDPATGDLCLRFTLRKGLRGLPTILEASQSPTAGWNTASGAVMSVVEDTIDSQEIELRVPTPEAGAPPSFYRLRIGQ